MNKGINYKYSVEGKEFPYKIHLKPGEDSILIEGDINDQVTSISIRKEAKYPLRYERIYYYNNLRLLAAQICISIEKIDETFRDLQQFAELERRIVENSGCFIISYNADMDDRSAPVA